MTFTWGGLHSQLWCNSQQDMGGSKKRWQSLDLKIYCYYTLHSLMDHSTCLLTPIWPYGLTAFVLSLAFVGYCCMRVAESDLLILAEMRDFYGCFVPFVHYYNAFAFKYCFKPCRWNFNFIQNVHWSANLYMDSDHGMIYRPNNITVKIYQKFSHSMLSPLTVVFVNWRSSLILSKNSPFVPKKDTSFSWGFVNSWCYGRK